MLVYLHIPYCDSKCHYCNFNSYMGKFDTRADYMKAILKQLDFELERFNAKENQITSVFIGGGTPSTIKPEAYEDFFAKLKPFLAKNCEITTEANPNSATAKWLNAMFKNGVNRISFGVQSFDDEKLKKLGRSHDKNQAIRAITDAKKAGFEHISCDLIYNAANDTKKLLANDIDIALGLPIDHISAYELTIEDGVKFSNADKQENDDLAFFVAQKITKGGFSQYEISNFGKYHCRHNIGYWELDNYIGIGAGAVGFLNDTRFYPTTDIDQYIKDPLNTREETISKDELIFEKIFLGLRSKIGINKELLTPSQKERADILVENKKLSENDTRYFNLNFFVSDEIALYITG
ncbi:MAG: coproporphyrinogen III oxidase family protein [Epsilonproteobacteria bacterium]|nr:coproporphyrinogen III oxidase family protein [Campylobacterota bacterium]